MAPKCVAGLFLIGHRSAGKIFNVNNKIKLNMYTTVQRLVVNLFTKIIILLFSKEYLYSSKNPEKNVFP